MNIVVCCKMVPDLVEELEVDAEGTGLDRSALRQVLNEFDEHALEQGLLLKEAHGATLTVLAPDSDEVDGALFTALAKGADRAVKVVGLPENGSNRARARALANVIAGLSPDLILTGVQAADDRDGQLGMLMAGYLDLPHVGVVTGVQLDPAARIAVARKEYAGGVMAEFEVALPAVLGIQAAPQPPRYAPVSKVRQAAKEKKIENVIMEAATAVGRDVPVRRMFKPTSGQRAEILEGTPEAVSDRIVEIFRERGFLR
jgi:electron transfer flavoprotein beta subunit